jgi:hypothetical protein
MGMLMPTIPTWLRRANSRATAFATRDEQEVVGDAEAMTLFACRDFEIRYRNRSVALCFLRIGNAIETAPDFDYLTGLP